MSKRWICPRCQKDLKIEIRRDQEIIDECVSNINRLNAEVRGQEVAMKKYCSSRDDNQKLLNELNISETQND